MHVVVELPKRGEDLVLVGRQRDVRDAARGGAEDAGVVAPQEAQQQQVETRGEGGDAQRELAHVQRVEVGRRVAAIVDPLPVGAVEHELGREEGRLELGARRERGAGHEHILLALRVLEQQVRGHALEQRGGARVGWRRRDEKAGVLDADEAERVRLDTEGELEPRQLDQVHRAEVVGGGAGRLRPDEDVRQVLEAHEDRGDVADGRAWRRVQRVEQRVRLLAGVRLRQRHLPHVPLVGCRRRRVGRDAAGADSLGVDGLRPRRAVTAVAVGSGRRRVRRRRPRGLVELDRLA